MPSAKGSAQLLTQQLAALSDMTRLRLMLLLEQEELGVGELAAILQLPQSTVSRHLKSLLQGQWIARRSQGTAGRYRSRGRELSDQARELWNLARRHMGQTSQLSQDQRRLHEILARRQMDSAAYFGRVGAQWDAVRTELFGAGFVHDALLALIPARWTIADLGCGTGNITELLAPIVSHVHAVDSSRSMLAAAKKRLKSLKNVTYHQADLLKLPLKSASCDAAVISLVLHHIDEPVDALRESARILKPGGTLLIIDMVEHDREEYKITMGHRSLGFGEPQVGRWCIDAGFEKPKIHSIKPDPISKGPDLFVAVTTRND